MAQKTRKVIWGRQARGQLFFIAQYDQDGALDALGFSAKEMDAELLAFALAAYRGRDDDNRLPTRKDGAF